MAKEFWKEDRPAATVEFWRDDIPSAQRNLPADVEPSTAGAGRGSIGLANMVQPAHNEPKDAPIEDQQVVTSARRWNGAAAGRGTPYDPRRLDTTGQSLIETEAELSRLAQINPVPRESLRPLAEFNAGQPRRTAEPVDRVKQYTDRGMGLKDAELNAAFDAGLQTRLNRRFQEAAPDERGDRIARSYNPNTDAQLTAAKALETEQAQENLQIRQRAQELGPVVTGLARGFGQGVGFGKAVVGFAGDLFGDDAVKQWGIEGYKNTMRHVGAMTLAKDFTELKTPEEVGTYITETLSYGAVQAAQAILSGGLGSALGGAIGKKVAGEVVGLAATNIAQELGSIYGDAQEEAKRTGKEAPPLWKVATGAIVAAAIDTVADKFGLDSVAKEGFRGNIMARLAKSMGSQMGVQGGTEMAQKVPEEWGAGKDPFRKGIGKEYINEGAAGSVMSGGPGVVGAVKSGNPNDVAARALAGQLDAGELPGASVKPPSLNPNLMRPMERLKSANDRLDDFAATHGIPTKAVDAIKKAIDGKPVDQVAGFVKRAVQGLAARGLVASPIDDGHLAQLDEPTPQEPPAAPEPLAQDVRTAMDEALALEHPAAKADPVFDPGNDIMVTPETNAVHAAATSPLNDLPEPSPAQKSAGNYPVGRMRVAGMDISIENPQGSTRRGVDPDGAAWETPMKHHYGYIRGTTATDGDKLDVFVKPGTPEDFSGPVFVVDQIDPRTGKLDEHKVVLGAKDEAEAESIYRANYTDDWNGLADITRLPMPAFKAWAKSGDKTQPLGNIEGAANVSASTQAAASTAGTGGQLGDNADGGDTAGGRNVADPRGAVGDIAGAVSPNGPENSPVRTAKPEQPGALSNGVKLFRGTPAGAAGRETVGGALFMSPDKTVADAYAGKDGNVTEETRTFKNLLTADTWMQAKEKLGLPKSATMEDLVNAARAAGHDGATFVTSNGREYIAIDQPNHQDAAQWIKANKPANDSRSKIEKGFAANREALKGLKVGDEVEFTQPGTFTQPDGSKREGRVVRGKIDKIQDKEQGSVKIGNFSIGAAMLRKVVDGEAQPTTQGPSAPEDSGGAIGANNIPIAEGGKPFKTKALAQQARALNPGMRVAKSGKGFVLVPKTAKQLAAQAQAAKRLRGTGNAGKPLAVHEFIASRGGLAKETMSDLNFDKNVRVGSLWLFSSRGGMTLEQATEALQQYGYMEGDEHRKASDLIQRSARGEPQYTPEGWEQIGQMEEQARYEDYLAAQREMADDFDPFASTSDAVYTPEEIAEVPKDVREEYAALFEAAEAAGIDTDAILEEAAKITENQTQEQYNEYVRQALTTAIANSRREAARGESVGQGREDAQRGGIEGGGQDAGRPRSEGAAEGLKSQAKAGAAREPRGMTFEGRATDGGPILPGDTFTTSSGRVTTPYPKQNGEKYASQWLIDNAAAEAESRGDDFNAPTFRAEKPGRDGGLAPASRDSMLEYLFGQQPRVVPTILKPLAPSNSGANVTPQVASNSQLATFIGVAADSIEKLRKVDVDRVIAGTPAQFRTAVAMHIKKNRPDLSDEVSEVLAELSTPPRSQQPPVGREVITPANDKNIGANANGEQLYERGDGSRYRIHYGKPDFGGDLVPADLAKDAPSSNGLTAPTRDQVIAQQDRKDNAQSLDDKAQIDAGDERKAINTKLDAFVSELKTKEDDQGNVAMFSRSGVPSRNDFNGWPKTRGWTRKESDSVTRWLPEEYRNDPHRREPLSAEGRDFQPSASLREDVAKLSKKTGIAYWVDALGNLVFDARKGGRFSAVDVADVTALADKHDLGIYVTGVMMRDMKPLINAGFVSESGLAPIVMREAGTKLAPSPFANTTYGNHAYGVIMSRKPRGFAEVLFARTPYYSALDREIGASNIKAAPAAGWKDAIKGLINKGAVKADEVEWSGLIDWLDMQQGKVQKDAVQEFLSANGVRVKEVVLGRGDKSNLTARQVSDIPANDLKVLPGYEYFEPSDWVIFRDGMMVGQLNDSAGTEGEAIEMYRQEAADEGYSGVLAEEEAKYSQYTLPGGTNYREVLLTLPARTVVPTTEEARRNELEGKNNRGQITKAEFAELLQLRKFPRAEERVNYKSNHWDQTNVLAHIRVNDRTDADGKRVLFVEEIQSDWGQEGKKKGIKGAFPTEVLTAAVKGGMSEAQARADIADLMADPLGTDERPTGEQWRRLLKATEGSGLDLNEVFHDRPEYGVPNAPFIGKTDAWLTLALKRIITMAVDGGYDKVAFVNGEQSAERYDLSKQIDRVVWVDNSTGGIGLPKLDGEPSRGSLEAYDKNGKQVVRENAIEPERVEEFVGKEVAQRLFEAKPRASQRAGIGMRERALQGVDLKVGGEGMRAFYDKIVPNAANALLKKVGGGKLEMVELQIPGQREGETDRLSGAVIGPNGTAGQNLDATGFTITEAMRQKASQGLPLFAREQQSAYSTAHFDEVQGWVNDLAKGWKSGPDVRVVHSVADLPVAAPDDARGLYYRGTAYVVANRIESRADAGLVLAHEAVAHYGLRNMLGEDGWKSLMRQIQFAIRAGNKELRAIQDHVRKHYVDDNGNPNLSPALESDEIAARAVEMAIDKETGEFKPGFGFVKAVYAKVMQFLRDLGFDVKFTHLELQGMLVAAQRNLEVGKRTAGGGQSVVAASRGDVQTARQDQTSSPEFKRWFGDSKVVDADGKPLVVYHGSGVEFDAFDAGRLGENTGYGDAEIGFHFSDNSADADFYASKAAERFGNDKGVVRQFYLSLQNPLVVGIDETDGNAGSRTQEFLDDKWAAKDYAEENGHDGVVYLYGTNVDSGYTAIAFRPEQIKSAKGNRGTFDPNDPDIRFSRKAIVGQTNRQPSLFQPNIWSTPEATKLDSAIYELQDAKVDLKRVQQAITESGNTIAEKWDARLAETLYPGRVAYRSHAFLSAEVKPLLSAMAANNVGTAELADYLHARGAPERNAQIAKVNPSMPDGGAGTNTKGVLMTTAAARAHIAAISHDRLAVLSAMAKRVDSITAGTRNLLVSEGLEKQETIDAWNGAYQHYVPMFRDEADDAFPSHPQGSGFAVKGSASKRATGSTKEVTNILAHVLMQREAAITRAEKNRVAVSLYGLALSHPNPEFWTTIKPSMDPAAIGAELQAMGVDPLTAQVGMEGVPTVRTVDPNTGKVVDRPNPMYKNMPGAIPLKLHGEDRVLMLNTKTERGLRLAESLKNLDGLTQLDIAGSVVGKGTRWIASVNTQYNPAFGLVNFIRDTLGGAVNLGSTELRGKALKVLADSLPAIWGVARELASNGSTGKWSALYRQFVADGGQTGYRENWRDPNDRAAAIEKEIKALGRSALSPSRAAHAILDLLDGFNTTLENAVRVSAYSAALDKGLSRAEAARLGRELTVDFNRKGRLAREIGPLYAFFNASVQGGARTIEAIKGPTGAKIIIGGLSLGLTQALMLAMAGYDDDEVPEFVKTRSLVIPLNWSGIGEKRHILIPYPLGLHVIPTTGRVLSELTLNGGKNTAKRSVDAVGEIAAAFNPLGGGNIFTADGALKTLAPTVIDPVIEIGFNKNFAGTPIEKQGYGSETDNRPGVARAKEATQRSFTGQAYMGISKAINSLTGGTDYEAGKLSPTPERVQYLAQVVGGGILRELEKAINATDTASRGEKVKPGAVPITGRFYGEVDRDRVDMSRYYEAGKKIRQVESSLKAMEKAGDDAARDKFEDAHPEVRLIRQYNKVSRSVSKLNSEAVQTIANPAQLKQIDADRLEVMRDLNLSVLELEKETGKVTLADRLRPAGAPKVAAAK